jgi:hypothetical protein
MTEIAEHRIGGHQSCNVTNVPGVERQGSLSDIVRGRLRAQSGRVHQLGFDVLLERAHFEVRHARHDADHDERDEERERRAQRGVPQPFRHSGAYLSAHGPPRHPSRIL